MPRWPSCWRMGATSFIHVTQFITCQVNIYTWRALRVTSNQSPGSSCGISAAITLAAVVQWLSPVWLFAVPWPAVYQAPCSLSPGSGHVISHHLQKEIQNTSDHTQVICKGWNHPEPLRVLRTARLSTAGALGVLFLLPEMPSFSPSLLSFSSAGDIVYSGTNWWGSSLSANYRELGREDS